MQYTIGETIKKLRKDSGFTQKQLADLLGCSTSAIGMYEQNRRSLDPDLLIILAEIFEVSVDFILGRYPKPDAENRMYRLKELRTKKKAATEGYCVIFRN